jgi:hypothetical protein
MLAQFPGALLDKTAKILPKAAQYFNHASMVNDEILWKIFEKGFL